MKKHALYGLLAALAVFVLTGAGCDWLGGTEPTNGQQNVNNANVNEAVITNFDECVAAGNPVMESYPRQCAVNGETFTEVLDMTEAEARDIAQDSPCMDEGNLSDSEGVFNENTNTWWIDMDVKKEGCAPACVVDAVTETAEINWRCTGLIEPEAEPEPEVE
ncbi:MAG: hypothetical protein ABIG66_02560 [Candidatus Kerfeldbacteria bacterium]